MSDVRVRQTARAAGAAAVIGGLVVLLTSVALELTGPATVIGAVLGAALVLCGVAWLLAKETPRVLPAATTAIGIMLVLGLPFLTRREGEWMGVAVAVHIVTGLAMAALGVWAGKRLRVPRADQL